MWHADRVADLTGNPIFWHRHACYIGVGAVFSNLLFLILVLLVVNLAPEASSGYWASSPTVALAEGLGLYCATLLVILAQNRVFRRSFRFTHGRLLLVANLELVCFLLAYHFLFASHRLYLGGVIPHTALSTVSLALYFGGLSTFYYSAYRDVPIVAKRPHSAVAYAVMNLRFLVPFCLPFLGFGLLMDLFAVLPVPWLQALASGHTDTVLESTALVAVTIAFMSLILVFLPPVMVNAWGCTPLVDSPLSHRLEALCRRAGFRHAGFKIWTVMRHSLTAAIVGVVARFRYVMFTESLLQRLPVEEVEAILAHEIGHSYRKHLLIYPFIIMGMMAVAGLFFLFFGDALQHRFALHELLSPSPLWRSAFPVAVFIIYAVIIAGYFRIVFGYFSRLFERQADLHGFSIGVHPQHMIDALDSVGIHSGNTHKDPSWHHFSIHQRIEFLTSCRAIPSKVERHHRRVRRSVWGYFIALAAAIAALVAPSIPEGLPGHKVGQKLGAAATHLNTSFNRSLRQEVAIAMITRYELEGNDVVLREAIDKSLLEPYAIELPGIAEFYAAQYLLHLDELVASARMMQAAWRRFDFSLVDQEVVEDFETVTESILGTLDDEPTLTDDHQRLLRTMTVRKFQIEQQETKNDTGNRWPTGAPRRLQGA